jgi:hypothetical protein
MREGTLWLVYICKYVELVFLIVTTVMMIVWGIQFIQETNSYKYKGPVGYKT